MAACYTLTTTSTSTTGYGNGIKLLPKLYTGYRYGMKLNVEEMKEEQKCWKRKIEIVKNKRFSITFYCTKHIDVMTIG